MKDIKVDDELHHRLKVAAVTAKEKLKDYTAITIKAGLKALAEEKKA